jgi:hypothetical protein
MFDKPKHRSFPSNIAYLIAANDDSPSLVGGFPRSGGGSLADFQPPSPSLPPPSDDANVNPPLIPGALPGAAGILLADIQHPPPSPPWKLKFTVTLHAGEFATATSIRSLGVMLCASS